MVIECGVSIYLFHSSKSISMRNLDENCPLQIEGLQNTQKIVDHRTKEKRLKTHFATTVV